MIKTEEKGQDRAWKRKGEGWKINGKQIDGKGK